MKENINGRTEHADYCATWRTDSSGWAEFWFDPTDGGMAIPGKAISHRLGSKPVKRERAVSLIGEKGWTRVVEFDKHDRFVAYGEGIHDPKTETVAKLAVVPLTRLRKPGIRSIRLPVHAAQWIVRSSPHGSLYLWTIMESAPHNRERFVLSLWTSDSEGRKFRRIGSEPTHFSYRLWDEFREIEFSPDEKRICFVHNRNIYVMTIA